VKRLNSTRRTIHNSFKQSFHHPFSKHLLSLPPFTNRHPHTSPFTHSSPHIHYLSLPLFLPTPFLLLVLFLEDGFPQHLSARAARSGHCSYNNKSVSVSIRHKGALQLTLSRDATAKVHNATGRFCLHSNMLHVARIMEHLCINTKTYLFRRGSCACRDSAPHYLYHYLCPDYLCRRCRADCCCPSEAHGCRNLFVVIV